MHWLLPEPKGERSYFSICSRIQALRPCISSNSSMIQPIIAHSAGSEGYSWWDWSTWRGRSRCNVPGHQLLQLSRYAGGMWSMYQAIWLIWGSVGEVTCISMVALMMTARLHFTTYKLLFTDPHWGKLKQMRPRRQKRLRMRQLLWDAPKASTDSCLISNPKFMIFCEDEFLYSDISVTRFGGISSNRHPLPKRLQKLKHQPRKLQMTCVLARLVAASHVSTHYSTRVGQEI